LQRRPRESLTPQQLREWHASWGCRGGHAATTATAATATTVAATATAARGGGRMQLQRRPHESLPPQQLREWYASWGCRGGRGGSRPGVGSLGAFGSGQVQLKCRPRKALLPQQLREWYAHSRGSLSTASCPYVIRTGVRTGQPCGTPGHTESRCFDRLSDAWRTEFGDDAELPSWLELLRQRVDIFALDYDAILTTMYALSTSAKGACPLYVPPDPGIQSTALGAGEVAALGARTSPAPGVGEAAALGAGESPAPGAGESALSGTAPTEVLHTFTLDSGASRSFFRDSTTLTPLSRPVAVSLADPSRGPVLAHSSTVLPCPAAPSGLLSGLHLPSFSTNLVSGADLQDAWVAASSHVFAAASRCSPASAPCSCRPLSHETLLWHHRLGHPSLPRLRGMASRALVSGLPRSLPPLPPGPAPTCVPCIEGRQRTAPHSSSFPPTEAPLQTLHMDVKGEVPEVLIDWIRGARRQLSESLHSDRGGEFSSDLLRAFCRAEGIRQTFTLPASPQQNGIAERRIGM
ncbi:unnamed protein product, partial [Closterium sp. NIES-53]